MTREEALAALARFRCEIDAIDLGAAGSAQPPNSRRRADRTRQGERQSADLRATREQDVFRNVTGNNDGPLDGDALQRIFERIIDEMRSLHRMRRGG